MSLCHPIRHADIKIQKQLRYDNLYLGRGKEAPRARVSPKTKSHVVFTRGDKLVARLHTRITRTYSLLVVPETVEFIERVLGV